jgi:hypothetical protein
MLRPLLLLVMCACVAHGQRAATPDDTAKFLAGLPVRGTPLETLSRDLAWMDHAVEFDKAWKQLDDRQLSKIRAWGPEFLGPAYAARGPVFYFFSGPDGLYAQAIFPNASTYVLAGLEPVGTPPDVIHLPPGAIAGGLANLRKSLNSVLSFSFFITKDMKVDLRQNQLSGTLPVLYVFLARAGCRIDDVDLVWLDKAGALCTSQTATPGTRITFTSPNAGRQTLYYFCTDLSNSGIKNQPGFLKFCDQLGQGRSLLKAASYLMHIGEFSASRDFLLTHSTMIVQDDSGIPVNLFEPARWAIRYCGSYPGPIDLFKQHYQPDLVAAYATSNPPPLGFGFGYRWHPSQSSLMIATPRGESVRRAVRAMPFTP